MKRTWLPFLLLALLPLFLATSCRTYTPAFVLSLHEFADPQISTRLSKQVRNASREWQYTIQNFPFLDARDFLTGELYGPDENGCYGLRLQTDLWSQNRMHHTAGANLGLVYAVVVDGTYVGTSHFTPEMRDGNVLVIEPLWNFYDASRILENLEDNRNHLRP